MPSPGDDLGVSDLHREPHALERMQDTHNCRGIDYTLLVAGKSGRRGRFPTVETRSTRHSYRTRVEVRQDSYPKDPVEQYHQPGAENQAHIRPASEKNGINHIQPAAVLSAPVDFERPEERNRGAGEQSISQDVGEDDRGTPEETQARGP